MPKVKYKGWSDTVSIAADDFKRAGVEDQNDVVFDKSNDHIVDVSDAAAEYLQKDKAFKDADDFAKQVAEKKQSVPADNVSEPSEPATSGAGIGDGPTTTVGGSTAGTPGSGPTTTVGGSTSGSNA